MPLLQITAVLAGGARGDDTACLHCSWRSVRTHASLVPMWPNLMVFGFVVVCGPCAWGEGVRGKHKPFCPPAWPPLAHVAGHPADQPTNRPSDVTVVRPARLDRNPPAIKYPPLSSPPRLFFFRPPRFEHLCLIYRIPSPCHNQTINCSASGHGGHHCRVSRDASETKSIALWTWCGRTHHIHIIAT